MTDYQLEMPFVVVTSRGGPYDDDAFTAGFHAGQIYQHLEDDQERSLPPFVLAVRADLLPQLELIAMKHGLLIERAPGTAPEWAVITMVRPLDDEVPT